MALEAGTKLGPYEIIEQAGAAQLVPGEKEPLPAIIPDGK